MSKKSLIFLSLVLFDILIGGSISTMLQVDGWTAIDQRINDVYQMGYGIVILSLMLYLVTFNKAIATYLSILFLGFVEDVLFYTIIPLFNPIIYIISGYKYLRPFPVEIGGWIGWVSRILFNYEILIPTKVAIIIAIIAIIIANIFYGVVELDKPEWRKGRRP